MSHTVIVTIAVLAIVGYVIGRQLLGEPQRGKRVILLPLVLTLVGAVDLGKDGRHPQTVDIVFIVLGAALAAAVGLGQGTMMRLELRDGGLWGQMPVKSLWLWAGLIASRVIVAAIASASGAQVASSTAPILFLLGVNRLAQAASIAPRAFRAGIPFAPEKDGSVFLSGLGGSLAQRSSAEADPNDDPAKPTAHQPQSGISPHAATWSATGRQLGETLSTTLQNRRSQRRHDGLTSRRSTRGRRAR